MRILPAAGRPKDFQPYLTPTDLIDSDHPLVQEYARRSAEGATDPMEIARRLYLTVRDDILYESYAPFHLPEHYRASQVIKRGSQFCIPKASLLCALARVFGIPSRLGFANVRNHLATPEVLEYIGSDIFVCHAFVELYLDGRWVKATPAFNRKLCQRFQVPPLEFNGREDSLFQVYNEKHQRYMEYMKFLGTYADVPVAEILAAFRRAYGDERVDYWIRLCREREQHGEQLENLSGGDS